MLCECYCDSLWVLQGHPTLPEADEWRTTELYCALLKETQKREQGVHPGQRRRVSQVYKSGKGAPNLFPEQCAKPLWNNLIFLWT
jgi:hypothetical protein